LQGCDQDRALADARDHGFTRLPRLATPLFAFRLWQRALRFAADVHVGRTAKAVAGQVGIEAIDAERHGEPVEVHIARLHHGRMQVHRTVTGLLPAAEAVAAAGQ